MSIKGPSESGKSELVLNLIKHRDVLFRENVDKIIVSVPPNTQALFAPFIARLRELHEVVVVVSGLSESVYELIKEGEKVLLLVEDQAEAITGSKIFSSLMTMMSHHKSIGVIFTSQGFFAQGRFSKLITTNRIISFFPIRHHILGEILKH